MEDIRILDNRPEYQQKTRFEVPFDVVSLPSQGKLYPPNENGEILDSIEVYYMTSRDEDIISSMNLIKNGTVMDVLLSNKIKSPKIDPKKLLRGDKNAILLHLRASSYGNDYHVNMMDPETKEEFEAVVDLSKLNYKELTATPDENLEFDFTLPMTKKNIKFKLLNSGEEDIVYKKAESNMKLNKKGYMEITTQRLIAQVMEIDGERNKIYIKEFIEYMPAGDALKLRKYIEQIEPNLDLNYKFTTPSGFEFEAPIIIGIDFFFPQN
ncbi:MAG: hypothetical protein ACOC33_00055 [bacterium]